MTTLYEIADRYANFFDLVERSEADGQPIPQEAFNDTLAAFDGELEDKVRNILYVMRNSESMSEMIKKEEQRLYARRKAEDALVDRLKSYLVFELRRMNKKNVKTPIGTVIVNDGRLRVDDEKSNIDEVPDQWVKIETITSIKKAEVMKAYKESEGTLVIPGIVISDGDPYITVR